MRWAGAYIDARGDARGIIQRTIANLVRNLIVSHLNKVTQLNRLLKGRN